MFLYLTLILWEYGGWVNLNIHMWCPSVAHWQVGKANNCDIGVANMNSWNQKLS
jgi:hypothetical protein